MLSVMRSPPTLGGTVLLLTGSSANGRLAARGTSSPGASPELAQRHVRHRNVSAIGALAAPSGRRAEIPSSSSTLVPAPRAGPRRAGSPSNSVQRRRRSGRPCGEFCRLHLTHSSICGDFPDARVSNGGWATISELPFRISRTVVGGSALRCFPGQLDSIGLHARPAASKADVRAESRHVSSTIFAVLGHFLVTLRKISTHCCASTPSRVPAAT